MKMKTIRVEDDVHRELVKLKGEMTSKTGEIVSLNDVLRELIKIAREGL